MAWVDIKEDVGNIVSDAASIPGNRLAGEAEYVKAKANQIAEPAIKYKDGFVEKGQREGYGEAIWQDVVQPIAGTSTSRGAVVGAAGALGADLLDPTPGINPMNIAGGGLIGAAVGTAVPYAYDAAQALSSPNSLLRGETYSKALEGAGIASGVTGPIDENIKKMVVDGSALGDFAGRGLNIAKNVTEGVGNAYLGGLAGVNQLGSDVSGFFGADEMEARLQKDADTRRGQMGKNSAVGAMAQELSYDAGMGGVLGKGVEVIGTGGKIISKWADTNAINRGKKAIDEVLGLAKDTAKEVDSSALHKVLGVPTKETLANTKSITDKLIIQAKKDTSMWPGAQLLTDLVGTVSPKTQKFLTTVWETGAAKVAGSKNAALRHYHRLADEAINAGYTSKEADQILKYMVDNPGKLDMLKHIVTKPGVGVNTAKLFGAGTGILADVED